MFKLRGEDGVGWSSEAGGIDKVIADDDDEVVSVGIRTVSDWENIFAMPGFASGRRAGRRILSSSGRGVEWPDPSGRAAGGVVMVWSVGVVTVTG